MPLCKEGWCFILAFSDLTSKLKLLILQSPGLVHLLLAIYRYASALAYMYNHAILLGHN